ncbi:methionine--tRNA ligase [Methyloceanibacter marginalis]|uniref:Methionine--tRNA ligase n=1 Tax=Methyloceanibacter marginalis TaxID=1774971 RepID=A0A1E3W1D8_9HYPH|nr:methionine--tRNA ligase [Methyloceanibacter marginalis]ODR99573.1 methionine--tRNA ligase [Methyloceanibacter marginalis]
MAEKRPYYITTAISYPNDAPHIGHAYEAVATDALARFRRLQGMDVFFLTGTDEHGIKMLQTARAQGISAAELADRNTPKFREMVRALNCSHDDFITTREARHTRSAQELWRRIQEAGDIYLDKYAGWYSVRDEAYYDEKELTDGADGQKLSPQGTPVEWVEEESYFFRLSAFQDRLLAHYEAHPEFIGPETRANEVKSFVRGGLQDLSVSRTTFDWGVPVPGDPKHIMYVWVDALTNYITGVGFPDEASESFQKYWPADAHIIGKDIIRFHAVYWPAFLMSAGVALPRQVFGHGFLYNRGEKMSKSVGNVVDPFVLASDFGVDQIRYFLLREVPFGQDGNYSRDGITQRINADLANDLGNLAQRSLSMIAKNCGGIVPVPGALTDADETILAAADGVLPRVEEAVDAFAIHKALEIVWALIADANRYFAGEEPWAHKKTDPERMGTILYVTAEVTRQIAILVQAVMPESGAKLLDQLAVPQDARDFAALGPKGRLKPGTALPAPSAVFPRYVEPDSEAAASKGR